MKNIFQFQRAFSCPKLSQTLSLDYAIQIDLEEKRVFKKIMLNIKMGNVINIFCIINFYNTRIILDYIISFCCTCGFLKPKGSLKAIILSELT